MHTYEKKRNYKNYNRFINSIVTILFPVMISSAYGRETKPSSESVSALHPGAMEEASSAMWTSTGPILKAT